MEQPPQAQLSLFESEDRRQVTPEDLVRAMADAQIARSRYRWSLSALRALVRRAKEQEAHD